MKVGILGTVGPQAPEIDGVACYLRSLAPRLNELGVEAAFFWTRGEGAGTPSAPYRRRRGGAGEWRQMNLPDRRLTAALADFIARERPDVLHVHWSHREAMAGLRDLPAGSPPVIVSFHTYEPVCPLKTHVRVSGRACNALPGMICLRAGCRSPQKILLHDLPARRVALRHRGRAAMYLAANRELAALAARAGLEPVRHVPLGVELGDHRPAHHPRAPVLLYAGRLRPEKGIAVLAAALPRVLQAIPEARVEVAGDGPQERLLRAAGSPERIHFLGRVPPEHMAKLYRRARVVVVPSVWKENFGLVGPEAMVHGTPVVAGDRGGIREWLRDGENGLAVPPGDVSALAEAMTRLLGDAELAARLGAGARMTAEAFAMPEHARKLAAIYAEVAATRA
jgi:glycosyltransferase involved in cell wall biosynthesis